MAGRKFGMNDTLRTARLAANLSQGQLAKLVGCTTSHSAHVELGTHGLSPKLAQEIGKVLGIDWWSLLEDNGP